MAAGLAIAALAAVSGTVWVREESYRRPLAGVRVTLRSADEGEVLAAAVSDARGNYRLDDLPRARVIVRAARPGYFALALASREETLVLDLSGGGELSGADFEARRGGVISGRLTDAWGDPVARAAVMAVRLADPDGRHHDPPAAATTDDRGIYRLYGLAPGRYELRFLPPEIESRDERPAPVTFPQALAVVAGAELPGIDLRLPSEPLLDAGGRITGVPAEERKEARLTVTPVDRPEAPSFSAGVAEDGSFTLPRLPPGRYAIQLLGPRGGIGRQVVVIDGSRSDLVVRRTALGRLSGRVLLAGRKPPAEVHLQALDSTRREVVELVARPPGYTFRADGVWPDTYSLRVVAPSGAYLMGPPEAVVPEGGTGEVELRVGLETARVAGVVKGPAAAALAHGRVAVARFLGGPVEIRTEQTDQNGRFEIRGLRPGEYRICAWPAQNVAALDAPATWERAGGAAKRFVAEAGAEIEIDLTAAP